MKNVIKVFVAIAVMGVMTVSAFAQGAGPGGGKKGAVGQGGPGGPGGPGGGQRRGNFMDRDAEVLAKLKLTDGQKGKVKTLKEATAKKMAELFKSMGGAGAGAAGGAKGGAKQGGGFAGMREKLKPVMDGYTSGLKAILTPPQTAAYEKGMKEMMEKRKAERGAGGPGAGAGVGAGKGKGKGKGGTPPPTA